MKRRDWGKNQNLGFTLIEVILTMAILGIVFIPIMGYFTDSIKYSTWSKIKQNGIMTAQSLMEEIKGNSSLENIYKEYKKREVNGEEGCHAKREERIQHDYSGGEIKMVAYQMEERVSVGFNDYLVKISAEPKVQLNNDKNYSEAIVKPMEEATSVKAVETKEERIKAASYFMAQNADACSRLNGERKDSGLLETDLNVYKNGLKKEIFMDFTRNGKYDYVNIYCEYRFEGSIFGVDSTDCYRCDWIKRRFESGTLKQVYLFYEADVASDSLVVTKNTTAPVMDDMYLICQNKEMLSSGYQLYIDNPVQTFAKSVYSNVTTNLVKYKNYLVDTKDNIARRAEIKVEVYPYNSRNEEDKYIELTGMKGM